jgi:hypothetical protein
MSAFSLVEVKHGDDRISSFHIVTSLNCNKESSSSVILRIALPHLPFLVNFSITECIRSIQSILSN